LIHPPGSNTLSGPEIVTQQPVGKFSNIHGLDNLLKPG